MSNNSVVFYENPGLNKIREIIQRIRTNGEPGFMILGNAQKFDSRIAGCNPSLRAGTKVHTTNGIFNIEDLKCKKFEVITHEGNKALAECFLSGKDKPLYEIAVKGYESIYATAEHKWLVYRNGALIRIPTADMQTGDKLPTLFKEKLYDHSFGTFEQGYFVGWMLGDGWLTLRKDTNKYQAGFVVGTEKEAAIPILMSVLESLGSYAVLKARDNGTMEVNTQNGRVTDFLIDQCGLDPTKQHLPSCVWNKSSEDFRRGLISGYIATDGTVEKVTGRVSCTSSRRSLLVEFQELLGFYGIKSAVTDRKPTKGIFPNGKDYGKEYYSYQLRISGEASLIHLQKLVTLVVEYKQYLLDLALANRAAKSNRKKVYDQYQIVESVSLTPIQEDVWDITVYDDAHTFNLAACVTGNCGEATLSTKQSCNLTTQNLLSHVVNGQLDWLELERTLRLITRVGCRQTTATQWHPVWDKIQKRDRLLGVSMTGVEDAFDILNWTQEEKKYFYNWAANVVRDEADKYNVHLGIERSMRVSLVKPEGSLSQLPTVSSGIGKAYAPYYFRRVRFSRLDPLAIALHELGLPVVPENGQGDDLFGESCNTWVFTFPIRTNAKSRAIDEPIESQFQRYLDVQTTYVRDGFNASNTLTVADDEWDKAAELMYKHWDKVIGITFLPRFDPTEGGSAAYPNMPYEPCQQEQYLELLKRIPSFTEDELIKLIAQYETSEEEYELDDACATGACPIR